MGTADITALVFSSTGTAYVMGSRSSNLYSINTGTGAATSIDAPGGGPGPRRGVKTRTRTATLIGHVGRFGSAGDLAFHHGKLYLASISNQWVEVTLSPVGGAAIGPFGVANVYGLALGDDDKLYAVAGTCFYSVDPITGAATFVVDLGGQGLGDAYGGGFPQRSFPL